MELLDRDRGGGEGVEGEDETDDSTYRGKARRILETEKNSSFTFSNQ